MDQMAICIDISKCTACRACQVACKNWNQLKAEQTQNRGTHENPPDLSANTWNRIVYKEIRKENRVIDWSFISDRCRHCDYPGCQEGGEAVSGAIIQDDSGAVLYTDKTSELDFDEVLSNCPYDIPRKDETTGRIYKCNMCIDRITNGLKPACVTTCSTGALNFGTKKEMLDYSNKRIKKLGGDANLYPGEEYGTFWILPEKQGTYSLAKAAELKPKYRVARKSLPGLLARRDLASGLFNFLIEKPGLNG